MANILIVDDSYIMRMKIKVMLSRVGHTVVGEAANGEQAVVEYAQKKPDIVTMDISMPVMDGILALKMILSRFPDARIIVISALDKKNMVYTALDSGAKNYILKPIDETKLIKTIEAVMNDESPRRIKIPGNSNPRPEETFNLQAEMNAPFTIDNRNGTFIINLRGALDAGNFATLEGILQSFLYIKPLSLIFNFGSLEDFDSYLMERIGKLVATVRVAGGNVKLSSSVRVMEDRLRTCISGVDIIAIG